jgi:hypothetical protein
LSNASSEEVTQEEEPDQPSDSFYFNPWEFFGVEEKESSEFYEEPEIL